MILNYPNKKTEDEIINKIEICKLKYIKGNISSKSKLIKGDNLGILKYLLNEKGLRGKIDLTF